MAGKDEVLFISAILRQQDHKTAALHGVAPEWFHSYPTEWQWIEQYIGDHHRCPSKTVFRSRWPDFKIVTSDDIDYCLGQLRDSHVRHSLGVAIETTIGQMKDLTPGDQMLDSIASSVMELRLAVSGGAHEMELVSEWEDIFDTVTQRWQRSRSRGMAGIATGFKSLDLWTGGPQPGDYWVVAARLGQGKTWSMIRMACAAMAQGYTVQYDSLEQSKAQVGMRAHAFLSREYGNTQFPAMSLMQGHESLDLVAYSKWIKGLIEQVPGKLIINDTGRSRVTPSVIAAQIERNHPDILFIDYLTLMNAGGAAGTNNRDWQVVADLSAEIKGIAMHYELPVIVAAQINRMGSGKEVPGAEHLSASDAIGQDADAVVTMVQQSKRVVKHKLAKYRHGADGGTWYSEFAPNTGVFREISGTEAKDLIDEDLVDAGKSAFD